MRKIFLFLLVTFFMSRVNAQVEKFNPYKKGLESYVFLLLDNNKNYNPTTIYVYMNEVSKNLEGSIVYNDKEIFIKIVNGKDIVKSKIDAVIEISPIRYDGKNLFIYFRHTEIEIKRKKITKFIDSGIGKNYIVEIDCDKKINVIEEKDENEDNVPN